MHMSDALVSPAVGGGLWMATAITTVYCARKVREDLDERRVPLMGVTGAFVFAAQMLNFTIPGTGSSGHLGGGLLLATLLGPHAAFLVMASILGVQALFFADGGLLALGANVFNLGFLPAFIAYSLVYRALVGKSATNTRILFGSVLGAIAALQLGALGVVLETTLSGISELPLGGFMLVMLPIHAVIGLVEGLVTAGVIISARSAQPDILHAPRARMSRSASLAVAGIAVAALVAAVGLSRYASELPDGLEWSIARVTGAEEIAATPKTGIHESLEAAQGETAMMPEYTATGAESSSANSSAIAGATGALLTLAVTGAIGLLLRRRTSRRAA